MEHIAVVPAEGTLGQQEGDVTVVPVERTRRCGGTRPIGAYVIAGGDARFEPAIDVERTVATVALAVVAVAAFATAGAVLRRRPAIGAVSMGPGGWLSVKGVPGALPALTPRRRPWWARALRAHRLVVE